MVAKFQVFQVFQVQVSLKPGSVGLRRFRCLRFLQVLQVFAGFLQVFTSFLHVFFRFCPGFLQDFTGFAGFCRFLQVLQIFYRVSTGFASFGRTPPVGRRRNRTVAGKGVLC